MKKTMVLLVTIMFLLLAGMASAIDLTDGLVAYYTLDDDDLDGTTVIESVSELNGTNSGSTTGITGIINEAFSFDGTNDYVSLPNLGISGSQDRTVSLWYNSTSASTDIVFSMGTVASTGNNFGIVIKSNTAIQVAGRNIYADYAVSGALDGNWHHIAVVLNGTDVSDVTVYFDNTTASLDSITDGTFNTINSGYYIGRRSDGYYFPGYVDEVAIYNRTLNSSEVTELYEAGRDGSQYPFVTAAPVILNASWNLSSAVSIENNTGWRGGNEHVPLRTLDTTPTIRFSTDINAYCRISTNISQSNYTLMGAGRDCATTGGTDHVCTVIGGDALVRGTYDQAWVACQNLISNNESLSAALNMTVMHNSNVSGDIYEVSISDVIDYTIDEYADFTVFSNWTYAVNDSVVSNVSGSCDYLLSGNYYPLLYNDTLELWVGNTTHEFNASQLGINDVSVNCSGTFFLSDDEFGVNVTQASMTVNLSSIWDYLNGAQVFLNGVNANYPLLHTVNITGSCFSYHLSNYTFTTYYYNNSVVYSNTTVVSPNSTNPVFLFNSSFFSTEDLYLDGNLNYKASLLCLDEFGVGSWSNKTFFVVDDRPVVSWVNASPLVTGILPVLLNWTFVDDGSPNCTLYVNGSVNQTNLNSGVVLNFSEGTYDLEVGCYDGLRYSVNDSLLLTYSESCVVSVAGLVSGERYRGLLQEVELSCLNGVNITSCSYSTNEYAAETVSDCSLFNVTLDRGWNELDFVVSVSGVESAESLSVWAADPDSNVFSYVLLWVYVGGLVIVYLIASLSGMGVFWLLGGIFGLLLGFELLALSFWAGLLIGVALVLSSLLVFLVGGRK